MASFFCLMSQNNEEKLNVGQAVQLFIELEGAEGALSLRHCLHLNVNSYI